MKTALLLLDFINDIVHPEGKIAGSAAEVARRGAIGNANRALETARAWGWLPVFVKVGFAAGYREMPSDSPIFGRAREFAALDLTGWGTAFHADLAVRAGDPVIVKPRIGAFYATGLEALLRAQRIERLVLCGVSTAWAVQAAAREGHDRDYAIVVVEDACAAGSEEEHAASIAMLQRIATIVASDRLDDLR